MSSNTIVNGAPMTILRGTQDLSTRTPVIEPEVIPTHCPKVYLFAQKGPTTPQLVVGNSRNQMYGDDTFDLRKPYATHQTVLSNVINSQGNAQMIERILPDDVGPKSNLLLCLDVLENQTLPLYERDATGNIKLDSNGQYVQAVDGTNTPLTVVGCKVRWVVKHKDGEYFKSVNPLAFGEEVTRTGTQTDPVTAQTSTLYPIFEFQASTEGAYFNNSGLRLWAPDSDSGMNLTLFNAINSYPFRIQVIKRANPNSTAFIVQSEFAESYIDFVLKPYQIDPNTDAKVSIQDTFIDRYQNLKDTRFTIKYGDFGKLVVYNDVIRGLVEKLALLEFTNATHKVDFTSTPTSDTMWKYNLFSAKNSDGTSYDTIELSSVSANNVRLTENTNIFMAGGFDGTMYESPTPVV